VRVGGGNFGPGPWRRSKAICFKIERMPTESDCEEIVSRLRSSSKLTKLVGSSLLQKMKMTCRPCTIEGPEGGARALLIDSDPLEIVLCTNRLKGKQEIEEVVVHELVHVYDHTNRRCDLATCEGLAYSEVRAAREAECNQPFPFQWLKSQCVRQNAIRSTANLFPVDAQKCVDAVFEKSIKDCSPFDEK